MSHVPLNMRIFKQLCVKELAEYMLNVECGREMFIDGRFTDAPMKGFPAVGFNTNRVVNESAHTTVFHVYGNGGYIVCDNNDGLLALNDTLWEFEKFLTDRGITPHGMRQTSETGALYRINDSFGNRTILGYNSDDDSEYTDDRHLQTTHSNGQLWEIIKTREIPDKLTRITDANILLITCSVIIDTDDRFDMHGRHRLYDMINNTTFMYEQGIDPAITAITHMRMSQFTQFNDSTHISDITQCNKCTSELWEYCYIVKEFGRADITLCEACVRDINPGHAHNWQHSPDEIIRVRCHKTREDAIRDCNHLSVDEKDVLLEYYRGHKQISRRIANGYLRVGFTLIGSKYVAAQVPDDILYTAVWQDPIIAGRKIIRLNNI